MLLVATALARSETEKNRRWITESYKQRPLTRTHEIIMTDLRLTEPNDYCLSAIRRSII
jgi:hypothetical protein